MGPLARHDLRDTVRRQVEGSIAKGARCLLGGSIPNNPGAYYHPTVLTDVASRQAIGHRHDPLFTVAGEPSRPLR
jgi:acyl-CoA reductase-like NAD-dependent aldehyde dehydrogenase